MQNDYLRYSKMTFNQIVKPDCTPNDDSIRNQSCFINPILTPLGSSAKAKLPTSVGWGS